MIALQCIYWPSWVIQEKEKKNAIKVYDKNRSAVIFLYYMILDKCPQILYDHHITHKCFGFAEYWSEEKKLY